MKIKFAVVIVVGIVLLLMSAALQAFESPGAVAVPVYDMRMQRCFAQAMVGMDSVINARLGVPAEHALALAEREVGSVQQDAVFDAPLLVTILAAYLWESSPHGYAIEVFYECAATAPVVVERDQYLPQ
jgi:hypothetical protein